MALQEQEVGVKVIRKEIWKEKLENITCRVVRRTENQSVACVT